MSNDTFSDIIDDRIGTVPPQYQAAVDQVLADLRQREQEIAERLILIATEDLGLPEAQAWRVLQQAGLSFSEPAREGDGLQERVTRIERALRQVGYQV